MKKLKLLILSLILSFSVFGQNAESVVYKVYLTEFYIYNQNTGKWVIETRNEDVEIDLVSYKNVINIQALTPTLYRIDKSTEQKIGGNGKDFFGYRYDAYECVNMTNCTLDLVRLSDIQSKTFMLSVIFFDSRLGKVNLRYYSTLK